MDIKRRLALLVGVLLAMLVLGAAGFLLQLRDSNAALQRFYNERVAPSRQLKTVADAFSVDVADSVRKVHRRCAPLRDTRPVGRARPGGRGALGAIVGRVRSSSESIAIGSAQIAAGNADLSQRTEAQASQLQRTAATRRCRRSSPPAGARRPSSAASTRSRRRRASSR